MEDSSGSFFLGFSSVNDSESRTDNTTATTATTSTDPTTYTNTPSVSGSSGVGGAGGGAGGFISSRSGSSDWSWEIRSNSALAPGLQPQPAPTHAANFPAPPHSLPLPPPLPTTITITSTASRQPNKRERSEHQHQHQQERSRSRNRPIARHQSSSSSSHDIAIAGPSRLAGKVAIPRTTSFNNQTQRRRSTRACEPCRLRKIKCEGDKPICRQCADHNVTCTYVEVKRVRDQKKLGSLTSKVGIYEQLLQEVERTADEDIARRIRRALRLRVSDGTTPEEPPPNENEGSESDSSSIGSLNELDRVEEDLNRSDRAVATGFFGKNSEVSWLQRLEDEAELRHLQMEELNEADSNNNASDGQQQMQQLLLVPQPAQKQGTPVAAMNYYLDDLDIPIMADVDPYALPPKDVANRLFRFYIESVHPSFNVISKVFFVSQYSQFVIQGNRQIEPGDRWRAVLNMIFAIGSRFCQSVYGKKGGDYDDVVYLNRARKLTLGENVIFEHANLQQIQAEFLVAFYFLSMCQVNRSFKFSSMAFRSAVSLGINLRLESSGTSRAAKEARCRLWWSIYLLEHLLTAITGRVSCVGESLSATPLPIPFEEEAWNSPEVRPILEDPALQMSRLKLTILQNELEATTTASWLATCAPSPSLFFHLLVDLCSITQAIINRVYSIQGLRDRASQVEQRIRKYDHSLKIWLMKVPAPYRFFVSDQDDTFLIPPHLQKSHERERISLAISYYSARITLSRPCLTRSGLKSGSMSPNPTPASASAQNASHNSSARSQFRNEMARNCVRSACSLLSVLPETPNLSWLVSITPWWCILHYIMQATTALLLHLSCCPPVLPSTGGEEYVDTTTSTTSNHQPPTMLADIHTMTREMKKALRWLHHLSFTHTAARRAFRQCYSVVQRIAPSIGIDISDIPDGRDLPVDEDTFSQNDEEDTFARKDEEETLAQKDYEGTFPQKDEEVTFARKGDESTFPQKDAEDYEPTAMQIDEEPPALEIDGQIDGLME
ncbi:hypothetical protein ASPACDRAFT_125659 [Aspergillus aculeatus ATCC 16872]|uniref:Zn(2)-C6 fungal-type domain-containing protein n=1 Tax=Aspergillus aculeatus (strain ATCC 16872 / CBS 172.66 / WB 5094) TaxID=690307 RepID=A0A1L9WJ27_ASPA1|nr:uncharacterized protein ASPACDRAFT_125659 [Aspergillus aculeatus ATCC 16872]OJJ96171.1 hypothetical protein ASPACDRAFT_125659 [Aspergillus aculeatus ATCC 16872]